MPWRESSPMSERLEFIKACLDRTERIVDICDRFGISEKTGHKLLRRFKEQDEGGLAERSHAPLDHPYKIEPEIAHRIVALRRKHPLYGAQKLRDWLLQHEPETRWPAASSIGELLRRSKLIRTKRRRHYALERAALDRSRTRASEPNTVWTADFKGQFRLTGGRSIDCYPLTVLDLHSHYLLGCRALTTTAVATTRRIFVRLFREYGLPQVIRTDNGVPFAQTNALGRLGSLAFWWVQLGIRPEHITPAKPSENGAHERFHKTLKAATIRPPAPSLAAQQLRFDYFATEYNTERPHESLPGHRPPGKIYTSSPRPYPDRLPVPVYPESSAVRLVQGSGVIKWKNHELFLSTNLAGQYVGLAERDGDLITIAYGALELGDIDAETNRFSPQVRWRS